jgi:hypothetical protein
MGFLQEPGSAIPSPKTFAVTIAGVIGPDDSAQVAKVFSDT